DPRDDERCRRLNRLFWSGCRVSAPVVTPDDRRARRRRWRTCSSPNVRYIFDSRPHGCIAGGPSCAITGHYRNAALSNYSITTSARASTVADVEAQRLCGLEVEHQFVLRRRLYWQISRLSALEDAADNRRRTAPARPTAIRTASLCSSS